jgi:hypothetical protein
MMAKSKLVEVNDKIAENVVDAYKKIETGVVDSFIKMSDKFVDQFLKREGERVKDAKARLQQEQIDREAAAKAKR